MNKRKDKTAMEGKKFNKMILMSLAGGMLVGIILLLIILACTGFFSKEDKETELAPNKQVEAGIEEGGSNASESPEQMQTSEETTEAKENEETKESQEDTSNSHKEEVTQDFEETKETQVAEESSENPTKDEEREEIKPEESKTQESQKEEELIANLSMGDAWGNDGNYSYKFEVTIENKSDEDIDSWSITLFGGEYGFESGWNVQLSEKDGTVCVKPVDYNGEIKAGAKIKDMGVILKGKEEKANSLQGKLIAETSGGTVEGKVMLGGKSISGEVKEEKKEQEEEESKEASNDEKDSEKKEDDKEEEKPKDLQKGAKGPDINPGDRLAGHTIEADSPLGEHGRLYVKGAQLLDQKDQPYQMHGISTHGLAWFPDYVSEESFRTFKNNWNADVMRMAMYTWEYGGYCNGGDQKKLKELVDKGVEYASKQGMYIIIDWHVLQDQNPNNHKKEAIAFFDEMSAKYADYGNVIYEICNEPNGGVSWSEVRSYAVEVIETIRKNDPYGIILVGTPQWSQLIMDAAADPLDEYDNIMYTMHFYAATHKDDLRKNMEAYNKGMPIFVSECSICDASGNGGIDYESAKAWRELMDKLNISYVAWSVCNKDESSALIKSNCSKTSDWADNELADTGKWFKESFTK